MDFKDIDAKLTIYALANGMDLIKAEDHRQLAWYRDGRDRGIRLRDDGAGGIVVEARAWNDDPHTADTRILGDPQPPQALAAGLSAVLEDATEAANGL